MCLLFVFIYLCFAAQQGSMYVLNHQLLSLTCGGVGDPAVCGGPVKADPGLLLVPRPHHLPQPRVPALGHSDHNLTAGHSIIPGKHKVTLENRNYSR